MDPFIIVMLVGMIGLMFFMQSRAKKQARSRDEFRNSLLPGQRVMTQGGLVGTIVAINEDTDTLILDSAGSQCEYMRAGIAKTLEGGELVSAGTPAATGGLAGTLANLTGAAAPAAPSADEADLELLDAVSKDYHESALSPGEPLR